MCSSDLSSDLFSSDLPLRTRPPLSLHAEKQHPSGGASVFNLTRPPLYLKDRVCHTVRGLVMIRAVSLIPVLGVRLLRTRLVRCPPGSGAATVWPQPTGAGGSHGLG